MWKKWIVNKLINHKQTNNKIRAFYELTASAKDCTYITIPKIQNVIKTAESYGTRILWSVNLRTTLIHHFNPFTVKGEFD